jgi:SPP1 family predicted phage head-tail adaptor
MKKRLAVARMFEHRISFIVNTSSHEMEPENWKIEFTTYAEINAVSENRFAFIEKVNFGNVISESLFLFKIRFISGINTKMRILFNERQFEIKRIVNINEVNKLIKIVALEI